MNAVWPKRGKALIGVVHLKPLPGAPRSRESMAAILAAACADARALARGGCHALVVENFGDLPFFAGAVPPETIAAMALALAAVRAELPSLPIGCNVLRNDARAALGLCAATGASFARVNVLAGAMLTDQGLIEGRAAELLRERARLCAEVELWADVHVKHASPLGAESLEDAAADAHERALADALIVSGRATGHAPAAERVARVRARLPTARLLIGSGLDEQNARALLEQADGAIVGTSLKRGARVEAPVDARRVERLAKLFA